MYIVNNYRAEGAFRGSAESEGEPRFIHVRFLSRLFGPLGKNDSTYDSKTEGIFGYDFG